ncbi:MAG TPA: radical SAM protein [Candidatus Hydrogenedentes bacterium]|nr:radical SAM protein [Candidatus Hydrogenedentota bacterium]HIJ72975.1 radical SAM protein [Candidatus Hydrogenedentota bacterium]
MQRKTILLVNPNFMRPPIGPIGLEYVASDLAWRGFDPVLCDLAFAADWRLALADAVEQTKPAAIGVSVRNIDDAYFASQDFVLETTAAVVQEVAALSNAPVVLGGVGFSTAPHDILEYTGADHGIVGEGETAFAALLDCLEAGGDASKVPGAVVRTAAGRVVVMPASPSRLDTLPTPSRTFAANPRYFEEGGQSGIETKRGCNRTCIYCPEPYAKGRTLRLRSPESVADEFATLLDQGIDVAHLCDSEFNLPTDHAREVCDTLVRRGIPSRFRWYTYACPRPFDTDLAERMARAGCVGVDFGVDHGDPEMLRRLGRDYGPGQLRSVARACRKAGLIFMFDLLLGGPGETHDSIRRCIDLMREIGPDRVGLSCGVRVYPNTPLARMVRGQGPLAANPNLHGATADNETLLKPIFFVDKAIDADIHEFVWSLVKDDRRFLAADPTDKDRNYNYNDNSVLANAIRAGARGAYWDILRRLDDASFG